MLLHPENPSPSSSVFDFPIQNHASPGVHDGNFAFPPRTSDTSKCSSIIISGGTGCNSLCSAFGQNACYVLPVSDDGGSSSEIIRLLGDIRSRLIRLIPPDPPNSPLTAIRTLLAYRLPTNQSENQARDEWRSIVEGKSSLWHGIPPDRKEAIRGFLVYFESEVLKRAHKSFSFRNGSVGNYLLAAAQGFFRSLPSAIFFVSSITNSQANILPVLVTNHTVTIAAELEDSSTIVGQCNISHPIIGRTPTVSVIPPDPSADVDAIDGNLLSQSQNSIFDKSSENDGEYNKLPSRISRIYYINPYGHEIFPTPNPEFLSQLAMRDILVYSCGSLWTSIMPCLALRGVASAIARSTSLKAKVLLLNSKNDRETDGLTASDYVRRAIVNMLRTTDIPRSVQARSIPSRTEEYPASAFITHLVYLKGTTVPVDVKEINAIGVECIEIQDENTETRKEPRFHASSVQKALAQILHEDGEL
ncbi:UPF0052-domain-containing protein [Ramaria rubella]|nr:UPF0052-domain-containing protein [Ramaria rubella]